MPTTSPIAAIPQQIPPQFRYKKLYSFPYPITGVSAGGRTVNYPVELTKYAQTDYVARLMVQIVGSIALTNAGAGTATGLDNPEGLLVSVIQQTTPQLNGITPVNNVSARGLLVDSAFMRGYFVRGVALDDTTATQAVDTLYEIYFKRPYVRKGAEYDHAIAKYSSDLLTLQFGDRSQLFTGGTSTWDLSGLTVNIFTDSDLQNNVDRIHNSEFFERTYPITATQTDFAIDTLPQGFLYSDLTFLAELDNVLNNTILNNINIEGGGRVWLPQGDNNASVLQRAVSLYRGVITDPNSFATTGIYPVLLRDGMYTKAIDSLSSPLSIKLNVTFHATHTNLIRLVGRRMVPGQSGDSNPRHRA